MNMNNNMYLKAKFILKLAFNINIIACPNARISKVWLPVYCSIELIGLFLLINFERFIMNRIPSIAANNKGKSGSTLLLHMSSL